MHSIFMPDRSVLIELFVDGSSANRHFHNLASWYGRPYIGEKSMSNPVDLGKINSFVKNALGKINPDSY